jgi:hypothetical protein
MMDKSKLLYRKVQLEGKENFGKGFLKKIEVQEKKGVSWVKWGVILLSFSGIFICNALKALSKRKEISSLNERPRVGLNPTSSARSDISSAQVPNIGFGKATGSTLAQVLDTLD